MKKIILSIIAIMTVFAATSFADLIKVKNVDKAMEMAKKDDKILILHFSGSSWCPPCIALDKKVLHTKEFEEFAKKNVVYVNIDFTRDGKFIDKDNEKSYEKLSAKYKIRGFPTLVLINTKNNKDESIVGYSTRTPEELIERIEILKK